MSRPDPDHIEAIERALVLLGQFSPSHPTRTVSHAAQAVGTSRPSARRILLMALRFALVVDGELAAAGAAGGQALQQGEALAGRAGAGLRRYQPGVTHDPVLVALVGVLFDEVGVVVFDQYLGIFLRQQPPGARAARCLR